MNFLSKYCLSFLEPVNCVLNQWSEWSKCTRTCGTGSKTRHRSIVLKPSYGGKNCSGATELTISCRERPCAGMLVLSNSALFGADKLSYIFVILYL